MVFLKIEYIRRDLPLLCIFYSQSTLGAGLYARMAFLQESALKEALESFSMLPKA